MLITRLVELVANHLIQAKAGTTHQEVLIVTVVGKSDIELKLQALAPHEAIGYSIGTL